MKKIVSIVYFFSFTQILCGQIYNPSNDEIGIGVASPISKLHVEGEGSYKSNAWFGKDFVSNSVYHFDRARVGISGTSNSGQFGAGIHFQVRNTDNTNYLHAIVGQNRNGSLIFETGGAGVNSPTEKMTILSTGYVGIGTMSPVSELDVDGTIAIKYGSALRVNVPDGDTWSWSSNSNRIILKTGWLQETGDYVDYKVPGATLNNALMRFTKDGHLGIGVSNPTQSLDVSGSINASGDIYSNGNIDFRRERSIRIKPFTGGGNTPSQTHEIIKNGWRHNQDYTSIHAAGITSNTEASIIINGDGNVGIGTTNPTQKLEVAGTIRSQEVVVELAAGTGPDYVFEPDYDLRTLEETKAYITENKHLPEIPPAREMEANGIEMGEMNMRLLKKIEELTLYQIELLERLKKAEEEIATLKTEK